MRGNPSGLVRVDPHGGSIPACAGGTFGWSHWCREEEGLSPRVRGNPQMELRVLAQMGSIPACAGEPPAIRPSICVRRVYPRVCGGTLCSSGQSNSSQGLSPRVSGEPCPGGPCGGQAGVYPRVCGGTLVSPLPLPCVKGLSPRVRGNQPHVAEQRTQPGSISACAGEPPQRQATPHPLGSIPACAGEPDFDPQRPMRTRVYPRVCGGTMKDASIAQV